MSVIDTTTKSQTIPLVSIIMPAYNSSATLGESIQSVVSQTFGDWELLVIDDCSQENLYSIVESFNDSRIHFIRLSRNSGVAAARNRGIQEAKGRYIAFLDSDDLWHPEKLEKQLHFMEKNGYAFTYTWYSQFKDIPTKTIRLITTKSCVSYDELLYGNDIGLLTVMIDYRKLPNLQMPLVHHEDYITWLNILRDDNIIAYALNEDLALYRISNHSLSSNKFACLNWTWKIYRENQHISFLKSCYIMLFYIAKSIKKHYL